MTDTIQIASVTAAAAARPVAKRASDPAPAVAPAKAESRPQAHTDTAKPVEPVVQVQPSTHLTITRDETANTFVYRSINADTGEVVWQYPVEQVLRMAHKLRELEGLDTHKVDQTV